jgi:tetratricopeptide (TPR) repeat protein
VAVAEALLDTAERLIPDTALALRAQCRNRRAIIYALRGRADARAEAESSIALARRAGDPLAEADGFRVLGQVLQYRGQYDSALVALRAGEDLYRRARNRSALANSLVWQAQALGGEGRFGEWREVMRRTLAEGEAAHNPGAVATAYRGLGSLAIMVGDFAAAADYLRKSAAISRETGDSSGVATTRGFLLYVALAAGDTAEGKRLAQLALAQAVVRAARGGAGRDEVVAEREADQLDQPPGFGRGDADRRGQPVDAHRVPSGPRELQRGPGEPGGRDPVGLRGRQRPAPFGIDPFDVKRR